MGLGIIRKCKAIMRIGTTWHAKIIKFKNLQRTENKIIKT